MRLGPGHLLDHLMDEAREREISGGVLDNVEHLLPRFIARIATMKDNYINLSDMPETAPYALTLITDDGPRLDTLMPAARKLALTTA